MPRTARFVPLLALLALAPAAGSPALAGGGDLPVVKIAAGEKLTWQRGDFSRWLMGWLNDFYNRDVVADTDANIDFSNPPFEVAEVDLHVPGRSGNPAILVMWTDSRNCGSAGCQIDIWIDFSGQGNYRPAGSFLGHSLTLGTGSKGGFRDLWLEDTRLRWNGKAYAR